MHVVRRSLISGVTLAVAATATAIVLTHNAHAVQQPITSVIASADDGNVPANTIDGNLGTRWSAEGDGQWIQFDLGTTRRVGSLAIAWHKGDERRSAFDVQASIDGTTWTTVLAGARGSGTTTAQECQIVWATDPRYVRIVGHGNDAGGVAGGWNSIAEVDVYSTADCDRATPTPAPTATPTPSPTQPGACPAKPGPGNTGPRYSILRTLTAAQALAELRNTGRLDRVRITGIMRLSGSDGLNWVISDSVWEPGSASYAVQAYWSGGLQPFTGSQAQRMRFEYVEVRGAPATGATGSNSALFVGNDTIWRYSELYGGVDLMKPFGNLTVEHSYLHGLHHPDGAHADTVQIQSGTGISFRCNTLSAEIGYGGGVGLPGGNAVLQTGSVLGPIQGEFLHNWVNGGNYTLRVGSAANVRYWFAGNRHGRSFRYGPVAESTAGKTAGNNVWDDTGQVLW